MLLKLRCLFAFMLCFVFPSLIINAQQINEELENISQYTESSSVESLKTISTEDNNELEKLKKTVEALQKKVEELEAKLNKTEVTTQTVALDKNISHPAEPNENKPAAAHTIPSFFESTELSGFVDAYYGYNFNKPRTDRSQIGPKYENQLRNFDTEHNQFSLNMVKLALEKKPSEESRLGFRTDLIFGPAAEIFHAAEPGGLNIFRYLQQAYLSYLVPAGKGLQVDVGKFVTHHIAEVTESKDNWNYSRSLAFALNPYYHFGVRATYGFNDKFSVMAGAVNGWNNVVDNNNRRSFIFQATVKPTSKLSLVHNYTVGPEQANNNKDNRQFVDGIIVYNATSYLSLMTNYFYGKDRVNEAGVHWKGIAGYLRYHPTDSFAISPRFEYYDDHDGFSTGKKQQLKEFTLTGEYKLKEGLISRLEYRRDFSNQNFFIKPLDRLVKAQSTLTLGVIYTFSSKD